MYPIKYHQSGLRCARGCDDTLGIHCIDIIDAVFEYVVNLPAYKSAVKDVLTCCKL